MDVDLAVEAVFSKLLVWGFAITVRGNIGGVVWDSFMTRCQGVSSH